ncbi:MAG TPA: hybrid sensor histidine kinase/response regulator [Methanoregulaceae archaeon]|nr:hybrid sensor histidine kinase/response regulator [Methanoregulaceae archaeon]HPD75798.1 hybrid sensor histidine kinase/response regulator [Methanoregulaceae archaeon]HRY75343.1 hybrid sensor histidine kinase/response regulator [Methanoregulaceae archaeon]
MIRTGIEPEKSLSVHQQQGFRRTVIYSVLYVDDEEFLLDIAKRFLEKDGRMAVTTLTSAHAALARIQEESFDAIISDYQMLDMDGITLLKEVRSRVPDLPFILFTHRGRDEVAGAAFKNGADFYIQKGGDPTVQFAELTQAIRLAVGYRRVKQALRESEDRMCRAHRQISLAAAITRHDIINEVTTIQGYLGRAEKEESCPETKKYFRKIRSAAKAIRDHAGFSRIFERAGFEDPQWLDVITVLEQQPVPDGILIEADLPKIEIFADPLLGKVFFNLMDNAARHGGCVHTVHFSGTESPDGFLIRVADDGSGISDDRKERIFDRGFGRNTGMGLFLVREILAITGISIRENGEAGGGASFEIVIPRGRYRIRHPDRISSESLPDQHPVSGLQVVTDGDPPPDPKRFSAS